MDASNTVGAVQKSDPLTYEGYAGAMASFVQTGDPNGSLDGVPGVEEGRQFLVTAGGVKQGGIQMLEERCVFWLDVAERVPI